MKTLTLILFTLLFTISVKAQTQEELAKAQQEYSDILANMMNCDTLEKTLLTQYKMLKEQGLTAEQLAEMKKGIDLQIKQCKENKVMYGGGGTVTKPNYPSPGNPTEIYKGNGTTQKPPFSSIEIPNAYQITYSIKDGADIVNMDMFLSATTANYAYVSKDPETGEKAYSIFKEANKMMYIVSQNMIMGYDFGKFQQSGQNLTPTKEKISQYKLKPTGITQTIAGYPCKELIGKTDDGSTIKIYVSYAIKSGSNVMPGARYKESEKALYQKFYGSSELGMFLKAVTTDKDGTITITATKVQKNPPQKVIDTKNYQYMNASNMMNISKPKK